MLKYIMKKIIVIISLLVFSSLAFAESEIKFDSEVFDFGLVSQDTVTHTFEFQNIGTSELIIKKISST